jgi:hypothetical protein
LSSADGVIDQLTGRLPGQFWLCQSPIPPPESLLPSEPHSISSAAARDSPGSSLPASPTAPTTSQGRTPTRLDPTCRQQPPSLPHAAVPKLGEGAGGVSTGRHAIYWPPAARQPTPPYGGSGGVGGGGGCSIGDWSGLLLERRLRASAKTMWLAKARMGLLL